MNTLYKSFAVACSSQIALLEFSLWVLGSAWLIASAVIFIIFQFAHIDFAQFQYYWLCANLPITLAGTALFVRILRELSQLSIASLIPGWQQSNRLAALLGYAAFTLIPILTSAIVALLADQAWPTFNLAWFAAAIVVGSLLGFFWMSIPIASQTPLLLLFGYAAILPATNTVSFNSRLSLSVQLQSIFSSGGAWLMLLALLILTSTSIQGYLSKLKVPGKPAKGSLHGLIETFSIETLCQSILMGTTAVLLTSLQSQKVGLDLLTSYFFWCGATFSSVNTLGALTAKASFLMWLPSGFHRRNLGISIFFSHLKRSIFMVGGFIATITVLTWIYKGTVLPVEKPHWICLFVAIAVLNTGFSVAMFRPERGKMTRAFIELVPFMSLIILVSILYSFVPKGSPEPVSALTAMAIAFGLLGLYAGLRRSSHWSQYELQDLLKPISV